MRQGSRGRQGATNAQDTFPGEVRRWRCERGLSREELARRTGYSRRYVSQLEQPSRGIPAHPVVAAVDVALEAGGALVKLREAAVAERRIQLDGVPDPERTSRQRMQDLLDHRHSDRDLDYLDRLVAELISSADRLPPDDVTARILEQQHFVDSLLRTPMLPHQQFRLFMLAGHLAGLMAISLLDMDELAKASTCCLEAAVFTELTGHEGLRAWTLAVNGLIDAAARRSAEAETRSTTTAAAATTASTSNTAGGAVGTGVLVPPDDADTGAGPTERVPDEALIAPGGRATPPKLVAMVKGRIARFATATAQRANPPTGLSHAFRPPV